MARMITFPTAEPDLPVAGTLDERTFYADQRPVPADAIVATEHMWWRETGRLAYPVGSPYPLSDVPLLVSDTEHQANMRAGIEDKDAAGPVLAAVNVLEPIVTEPLVTVETRLITEAPERRGGRPRLARDQDGNVIR